MMPSFNLVLEKWIPCLLRDGGMEEFGLFDVLTQARDIKEIFDPSPLVVTSLHRLLLAILHRNFGPGKLDDWKELWQRGLWDEKKLHNYFNSDKCRDRFYLFHTERPFYQVPRMDEVKEPQPIQKLAEEIAVGNNPTLFDHTFEERPVAVSPAIAAKLLLAHQAFALQGGNSTPFNLSNAPLVRGYTVLILGQNLFETLALNLIEYSRSRPFEWMDDDDPPVWERKELRTATLQDKEGTRPRGYLDYLTWQSRRIHLILSEGSPTLVTHCQVHQNFKVPDDSMHLYDPFKSYAVVNNEIRFFQIKTEKAVWRDCYTLFESAQTSRASAGIFEWLAEIDLKLAKPGMINATKEYNFIVTGLANNKGKAELWRQERLPLPLVYLEDEELLGRLNDALALVEGVSHILRNHFRDIAKVILDPATDLHKARKPDSKALRQAVDNLLKTWAPDRLYFSQLESLFQDLLVELPKDRQKDEEGDNVGVRVNRQGLLKMDYHTAGVSHRKGEKYGVAKADGGKPDTVVSHRYYLANADFLVGLEGDEALLRRLEAALVHPVWPICLGRKAFVPSPPVRLTYRPSDIPGSPEVPGLVHLPLKEALSSYPWLARTPREKNSMMRKLEEERRADRDYQLRLVLDAPFGSTAEVRPDVPLSFAKREFTIRYVKTDFMPLTPEKIQEAIHVSLPPAS